MAYQPLPPGPGRPNPATFESEQSTRLVVWQTGLQGLDWLRTLVKEGKAVDLGGNGYPVRYTAQAQVVLPIVVPEPPLARKVWSHDATDVLTEKWAGTTIIDEAAVADCSPQEWLLVEAWDES